MGMKHAPRDVKMLQSNLEDSKVPNRGSALAQHFSNFNVHMNHLGIVLNVDSNSVDLEGGLRFCISNLLPGDTRVDDPWTTSEKSLSKYNT